VEIQALMRMNRAWTVVLCEHTIEKIHRLNMDGMNLLFPLWLTSGTL